MMKAVVLVLVALVGLSHQVPVEVVVGTQVVEVTKMVDVTTTVEPEVEMNPFGECPPEDVFLPTYLPDTKNCSVFYQCAHGVPYRMECRLPLEFNPTLNVCDYPYQSGCLLKVVESENEDEENADNDEDNDQENVETATQDGNGDQDGVETATKDETDNQEVETATKIVVVPADTDMSAFAPVLGQVDGVVDSVASTKSRNNHN